MGSTPKSVVDMIEASSKVHYSGFHMNGHINGVEPACALQGTTSASVSSSDIQRQPFVIGLFCFFYFLGVKC